MSTGVSDVPEEHLQTAEQDGPNQATLPDPIERNQTKAVLQYLKHKFCHFKSYFFFLKEVQTIISASLKLCAEIYFSMFQVCISCV